MKLDIEALAREAGFITGSRDLFIPGQSVRFIKHVGSEGCGPELERLARLIVERCAAECDYVYHQNIGPGHGGVRYGVDSCAAAIRQLLEDK